jgi:hypothetical protein
VELYCHAPVFLKFGGEEQAASQPPIYPGGRAHCTTNFKGRCLGSRAVMVAMLRTDISFRWREENTDNIIQGPAEKPDDF